MRYPPLGVHDYLELLRLRPAFRTLWMAETISLTGDWFTMVAVSLLTLGEGDRVVLLALSFIAHTLPQALLAPLAGPLADFVDRRRALVTTAWAQCAVTTGMVAAALSGFAALLPLLVLLRSVFGAMREPAANAALPRLVEEGEVLRANALLSLTWSATFAIGMSLGGLVAGYRADLALAIDAVSFASSGLLLMTLPAILPEASASQETRRLSLRPLFAGMWEAVGALRDAELRRAVLGKAPIALAGGAGWIVLNLTTRTHPFLGTAGVTLGVLQGLRGVSTGVGPVVAERFQSRGAREGLVDALAVAVSFVGIAAFVVAGSPWAISIAVFVWGCGIGSNWVVTTSRLQQKSPRGFIGRLSAIDGLGFATSMSAAALATAWVAERTGNVTSVALAVVGLGVVLELILRATSGGFRARGRLAAR